MSKFSFTFALAFLITAAPCIYAGGIAVLQPKIVKLGILDNEEKNARFTKCSAELTRVYKTKVENCVDDIDCFKKNESASTKKCIDEFLNVLDDCTGDMYHLAHDDCGDDGRFDCGYSFQNMKASSTLKSQGANNYGVQNLSNLDVLSAWSEGVTGYGIGETITGTVDGAVSGIYGIRIINGYSKSKSAYYNNSRVKELLVYKNGTPVAKLQLKDIPDAFQEFDMPLSSGDKITFEIVDVYKGKKYDDTLLTLLTFMTVCY